MLVKNKKLLIFSVISIVAVIFVLFASPVLAELDTGLDAVAGETGLGDNDLVTIVGNIIKVFLGVLGVIGIVIVLYAGFLYMTSGGNQDQIQKARKMLISALIGLVIILSAYAITAFIIRQFGDATGAGDGTSGNNGCIGTQCLNIGGQKILFAKIIPNEDVPIYNFSVKVVFNYPLTQESVDNLNAGNHIVVSKVEADGTSTDVEGTVEVVAGNKLAYFTPSEACPPECSESSSCFDKDSDYSVVIQNPNTIKSTVLDSSDSQLSLYCGEFAPCTDEFGTGNKCDKEYPEVILEEPGKNQAYCRGFDYPVNVAVQASDDTALAIMYYVFDSEKTGELAKNEVEYDNFEEVEGYPTIHTSYFTWENDLEETEFLTRHTIAGGAIDIADHVYQKRAHTIRLYDPVCCDDDGEFICNDADPQCPKCTGGDCTEDSDCVFKCVEGKCVAPAVITNVLPSEGDFGALVTIVGSNFGSYDSAKSKVFFYNDVEAELGCDPTFAWSNNQIIAQVPEGFSTGAIKITTINDEIETTSDEDGWIGDFIKNPNVNYPGICEVSENTCGVCQVCKSGSRQNSCLSSCSDLNSEECTTCVQTSCSSECPGDLFEQNSCAMGEAEQTFYIAGQGFENDSVSDVNFGVRDLLTNSAGWTPNRISGLVVPNVQSGYTSVAINKGEYCAIQTCTKGEGERCEFGEEGCNCSLGQVCGVEQKHDGITEGYDKDSDSVIDYVCGCYTNGASNAFESFSADEGLANCEYDFGCYNLDYSFPEFDDEGQKFVSMGNCNDGIDNDGNNEIDYSGGYIETEGILFTCGCNQPGELMLEPRIDILNESCPDETYEKSCVEHDVYGSSNKGYDRYNEEGDSVLEDLYYYEQGVYSIIPQTIKERCGCYNEQSNKFEDYRALIPAVDYVTGEELSPCFDLPETVPLCIDVDGNLVEYISKSGNTYIEKDSNCAYASSSEGEVSSSLDAILDYEYIEIDESEDCVCQNLVSNPVRFNVLDTVDEPVIDEISPPNEAPANQLITIKGKNFLDTAGRVIFVRGEERFTGAIGCEGSGWSNYEITVKIPDELKVEDGGANVSVDIVVQTTNNLSDTEVYQINNSLPVAGLCRVRPNNGPVRTPVSIVGENLGANNTIYDIYFKTNTTAVSANEVGATWNSERIGNVLVPNGVELGEGEVYLQNDGGDKSNSLDFRFGSCSADSCLDGEVCCPDGVCSSVTIGCRANARAVNPSEFAWQISTGILPNIPKVLERTCIYGGANISASPLPSKGLRDACPNELISATFNQPIPIESFNARTCLLDGLPDVGLVCDPEIPAANCECEVEATPKVVVKMCSEVDAEGDSAPCDLDLCCAASNEDRDECEDISDTCVKVNVDLTAGLINGSWYSPDLPDNNLEYSNADGESCNVYDPDCEAKKPVSMLKLQETFIEEDSAKYEPILQTRGSSKLMPNMWYQVEIAGGENGVRNAEGYYLPETYKWKFKTADTDCIPEELAVTPAKGLIEEILGQEIYNAYAVLGCKMLGDLGDEWYWDVSNVGDDNLKASFQGNLCIDGESVSVCFGDVFGRRANYGVYGINPLAIIGADTIDISDDRIDPGYSVSLETTSDDLVQISAEANFGQGLISEEAELEINFIDPKVVDYYPICDSACINTQVRAGFNTQMQESTIEAVSGDDGYLDNVYIFPCTTVSCTAFSIPPQPENFENFVPGRADDLGLALTENDINYIYSSSAGSQVNRLDINFSNGKLLEPNRSYRVVITNDVKSLTGKRLTELNYALNSDIPVNCMDGIDNDRRGGVDFSGGYSTA